jgi:hypothetical protein
VSTYHGDPEPNVRLRQAISNEVIFTSQHPLEFIQRLEKGDNSILIGDLACREPRLVHAIYETICAGRQENDWIIKGELRTIDSIVDPLVEGVDLCAVGCRIDINGSLVSGEVLVECCVEDADNLGALVVYDRLVLFVPKDRNGKAINVK